ncbi:MAG TPA: agmatinase, partial [Candidatus Aenigmarchaeota archaeon]|nr:agmatinase [Candidatus Aenigmarchaeota archaeon]
TVVQLDAHRDLVKREKEKYAHNTWAYYAINQGFKLVQIGARSWDEQEERHKRKFSITDSLKNVKEPVYLTIDMDVFDPSYAPETGFHEPGGLTPREVFKIIDRVFKKKVIGMDVMELSSKILNTPTSSLAARTILRALSNLV